MSLIKPEIGFQLQHTKNPHGIGDPPEGISRCASIPCSARNGYRRKKGRKEGGMKKVLGMGIKTDLRKPLEGLIITLPGQSSKTMPSEKKLN